MGELLRVLREWLLFFFTANRYRFVDSQAGPSFNDAFIELASSTLRWRLVQDRAQIFLNCRPAQGSYKDWEWYSADILIRLLTGRRVDSAVLTLEMASWFGSNLSDIEERFSEERLEKTKSELKKLEQLRAKELFG
ncbi:MAG: hypothetical protein HC897_11400 [Thermoanaerobaculia bacterium]|nr:hypothetical protein [Thermoanaerobaculia bacterium]